MKKIVALILVTVMALVSFAGCSDSLYDDFENYLNVQMADVNANYDLIKEETANWEAYEEDAEFETSLKDILIPLVDDSLAKLEDVAPQTEEVKELKAKYVDVMDAYKAAFEQILEGVINQDADTMNAGSEKLEEGIELLDDYNAGLEALAKEVGAEIEY